MSYREELIQVAAVAIAMVQDLDVGSTALVDRDDKMVSLTEEVMSERERQERKWGAQHHDPIKWYAILGEEVGEVARSILEKDFGENVLLENDIGEASSNS